MGLITTRELVPELWPALERLFGKNGACGGCWCMFWRIRDGERYEDVKGPKAKRRFKALVRAGKAHGVLAFDGDEPVGWCAFERRVELPRLQRAPSLRCDDAEKVWSLPCFYVKAGWRRKGVAGALLAAAVKAVARHGGKIAEGYPAPPPRAGLKVSAWVYTGVPSMFERAGFEKADAKTKGKMRYRRGG